MASAADTDDAEVAPGQEPPAEPREQTDPSAPPDAPTPQEVVASPERDEVNRSFGAQGLGPPSADYKGPALAPPTAPAPDQAPQSQDDRYAAARAQADKDFLSDFLAKNPLKTTFDVPSTPTFLYRQAERQSDIDFQLQQRQAQIQEAQAQRAAKSEADAQQENQFKATGQRYFRDELGNLRPITEPGTNRALFEPKSWFASTNPKTNEPAWEMRDQYGQRQFRAPPLVANPDLSDDNAYYKMPGGAEPVDSGRKLEDFAQSKDPLIAASALRQITQRNSSRRKQALEAQEALTAQAQLPFIQAQQQQEGLVNQIANLKALADAEPDPAKKDAYASQQQQLLAQHDAIAARTKAGGDLYHQNYAAARELALARANNVLETYRDQNNEIEGRLRAQGKDPTKDPTWQQNQLAMQQWQAAVDAKTAEHQDLNQQQANRSTPVAAPETAAPAGAPPSTNQFQGSEPFALLQKGVNTVGAIPVQELANRYGSGQGPVQPLSLIKIRQRSDDLKATIAESGANLDPKVDASMKAEQAYLDDLYKQRYAQLKPGDRIAVDRMLNLRDTTSAGAFARAAGVNAGPAVGSLVGASLGARGGAMLPGEAKLPGTIAGTAIGALAGGLIVEKAQREALKLASPESLQALEEMQKIDEEKHPFATAAGQFLANLAIFKANTRMAAVGLAGLFKIATNKETTALERMAAQHLATQAGLGAGTAVAAPLVSGQKPNAKDVTQATAQALIFGEPRFWGHGASPEAPKGPEGGGAPAPAAPAPEAKPPAEPTAPAPEQLTPKERAAAAAKPGTPEEQAAAAKELEKGAGTAPATPAEAPKGRTLPEGTKVEYLGKRNQVMEGVGEKVDHWQVKLPGEDRGRTLTREQLEKDGFDTSKLPTETPANPPKEIPNEQPSQGSPAPIRKEGAEPSQPTAPSPVPGPGNATPSATDVGAERAGGAPPPHGEPRDASEGAPSASASARGAHEGPRGAHAEAPGNAPGAVLETKHGPVEGEHINKDWRQFSPESKSLGVPRAEMPQVKSEDRPALVDFLKGKGIESKNVLVRPSDLKPTQAEYSPEKVQAARDHKGGDRNVLVSSDNYVVDGHHQWMADLTDRPARPIKVTRLNSPIKDLLPAVREFPKATTAGGAAPATTEPNAVQKQSPGEAPVRQAPENREGVRGGNPVDQGTPGARAPEGQASAPAVPKRRSDRIIEALQAAKIGKPGMVRSSTGFDVAHDAALDVAILAIKAGRTVADAVAMAVSRLKALHPEATPEHIARLESVIKLADRDAGETAAAEKPGSDQRVTSIKNAVVDEERAARGLPPAMQAGRRAFGTAWDTAMRRIEANPGAQDELIAELKDKPRALTDVEDAMLLHRQIDLQNQFDKNASDLIKGAEANAPADQQAANRLRAAALSDRLLELYNVGKAAGTETGRGLNARKMLAKEDFSLGKMTAELRAAKGGVRLSDRESAMINTLHDKIMETQKAFDDYKARTEDRQATAAAHQAVSKIMRDVIEGAKKRPADVSLQKYIADRAAEARQRIRERATGKRVNEGVSALVADLGDRAIIGAEYISKGITKLADFAKEWTKEWGPTPDKEIERIFTQANTVHDKLSVGQGRDLPAERASTVEGMKAAMKDGKKLPDLGHYVQKLAEQFVREGVTDRDKLIDAVHGELKKVDPAITRRQAMDAISGYGQFKPLSTDEVQAQLRDLKGQMQQVGKLEDMQKGQAPSKTGIERRTPSDEERRLIQQVNEQKRRGGFNVTDPAQQLKSALEGIKTRMRNAISDLDFQIATGKKTVKTRTEVPLDEEAQDLKARRDELKKQFDEIFQKPELTDGQRLKMAMDATDRQIAEVQRQLKEGDVFDKTKPAPVTSPELEAKRAELDALKEEREYARQSLQPGEEPKTKADIALQAYKTRTRKRIAELQRRLAAGDVTKEVRNPVQRDPEADRLFAENEKAKLEFKRMVRAHELNQRSWWEKATQQISGAARASALSGYHTLAKLASFTGARLAEIPTTEAAGKIWGQIPGIKDIAARAKFEGAATTDSIAKLFTSFAGEGMRRAAQQLREGTTDTKLAYGKRDVEPPNWYDFFGNLHAAEKTPLLTGAHEMYMRKAYDHAIANQVDVTDPMVQGAIRKEAFDYANRQILQENNEFAQWINSGLARMQAADPKTGRISAVKSTLAEMIRTFVTKGIVRTPANYVMQTLERTPLGLVEGLRQAGVARYKGLDHMKDAEADGIMRLLSAGAVGSGMFLWGMIDATHDPKDRTFGGYYAPGDKRDPSDVGFGAIRAGGHTIPHLLSHNPMTESAQMGSTFMRVMLSKLHPKDRENQGALSGALASIMGLMEQAPIANQFGRLGKIGTASEQSSVLGEALRGLIPQLSQNIAEDTDKSGVAHAPKTVKEHVEMGVPGLREQVPGKQPRAKHSLENLLITR